jgi:hypothetical protein
LLEGTFHCAVELVDEEGTDELFFRRETRGKVSYQTRMKNGNSRETQEEGAERKTCVAVPRQPKIVG